MLALAMVREGASRADAARLCGMDRQTLCDWVHRYNAMGLAGLYDNKQTRRGPKPRLSPEQKQAVAEIVRQGPDPAEHGVVRWRRIDLVRVIQARFGVPLGVRSVGTLLRSLGFCRLSARPQHPAQDIEAPNSFGTAGANGAAIEGTGTLVTGGTTTLAPQTGSNYDLFLIQN